MPTVLTPPPPDSGLMTHIGIGCEGTLDAAPAAHSFQRQLAQLPQPGKVGQPSQAELQCIVQLKLPQTPHAGHRSGFSICEAEAP